MAGEWTVAVLEDCMSAVIDYRGKTPKKRSSGIPLITAKVVKGGRIGTPTEFISVADYDLWMRRGIPKPGDVVLTTEAPLGEVAQLGPERVALAQRLITLRGKPDVLDNTFLKFLLQSPPIQDQLRARASGTTVSGIKQSELRKVLLRLPPIADQRAIGQILGALDDKFELNRRMNETLEAMAQALFKSWFVDFDPVSAKAAGREPGLPEHLADLFPDSFEDSELGEIPKGWEVKKVEDVANRVGMGPFGSSIKVETFLSEGVPIISGQHLHGFMMEDTSFNFISADHAARLKSAIVERGDVVFTHAGNIGQVAYIPETSKYDRYVISQRQFFLRCNLTLITPSFVTLYFRSPEGQHGLLANTSSSGVPSIARPVTYLRSIQLVLPPKAVMYAFEGLVKPFLEKFRWNLDESNTVTSLRDALLPKLLSGEIRLEGH